MVYRYSKTYNAIVLALFGFFDEVRTASCGKKNNNSSNKNLTEQIKSIILYKNTVNEVEYGK
ncbi:hypothetical protein BPP43_04265 [Brachyspira pilosicoli P43/6/78]|uniref:Uncharacterized protein n=1 Tax=Brachyspira pilosicoli P43/6/78 TaxID=1042417 RepID=A0A3B6VUP6_BRAPL|nr:hypothetical protein BPP43_04265 [Brachyspira pilosicoli P43/6/78]